MSDFSAAVGDQVPVGSVEILSSPHVSEGPGKIANAPVPSIYVDDRGDIHRLRVGGKRVNLLYSVQNVMRSGYLHPHEMHDTVVAGKVEVWTLTETGTVKTVYSQYDHFVIHPYVPHILYFLEDSILCEWWNVTDFSCYYYHPYRKIIDIQNSLIARDLTSNASASGTGRHQRLIPQDEVNLNVLQTGEGRYFGNWNHWGRTLLALTTATTVGLLTGFVLGLIVGGDDDSSSSSSSSGATITHRSTDRSRVE